MKFRSKRFGEIFLETCYLGLLIFVLLIAHHGARRIGPSAPINSFKPPRSAVYRILYSAVFSLDTSLEISNSTSKQKPHSFIILKMVQILSLSLVALTSFR
jgi:hypothetical protein